MTILAVLMTFIFSFVAVSDDLYAAAKADMEKANVMWDLKNNKALKFKTTWVGIGVRTHTVKMTNYKVTKASKEGYKKCTFTLTFNRKINPTKEQVDKMAAAAINNNYNLGGGYTML